MNILVDTAPQAVEIDGTEYRLKTSFRDALLTMLAFEDRSLTMNEKAQIVLVNLYEEIPENTPAALDKADWFLNGGAPERDEPVRERRLYSFSQDANYIYAAFRATHGIDLGTTDLHWWHFLSLFMDLGQDTTFCQMVAMRKRYYAGKCTREERQAIAEMGSAFYIEDNEAYTLDELNQIDELNRYYQAARQKRANRGQHPN